MRLIDADALYAQIEKMLKRANNAGADEEMYAYLDCQYAIEEAKTIEAVPVVRCKDCKYNYGKEHGKFYNPEDIVCAYWETDGLNDDDFCSYGERSEDGKERRCLNGLG